MRLNFDVCPSNLKETPQQKPCAVVAGYVFDILPNGFLFQLWYHQKPARTTDAAVQETIN